MMLPADTHALAGEQHPVCNFHLVKARFMKRVLILEDNLDIRKNTAEILELAGYEELMAENGKAGATLAVVHHPDLILCDICCLN